MNNLETIRNAIITELADAGKISPYKADANEPDPRYVAYGVRAKQKKEIFKRHRPTIRKLTQLEQIELGTQLIQSGIGEQQSLGLWALEPHAYFFSPAQFDRLDALVRSLYGWSKVDEFTGSLLRDVLFNHPEPFLKLVQNWNDDQDRWLRRCSVVLFTRKVAQSGQFLKPALKLCDQIKFAPENLVRKGIGWALKDLMRSHKEEVLDFVIYLRRQHVSKVITTYALRDLKAKEKADFLAKLQSQ